jgi:hypothetical protein
MKSYGWLEGQNNFGGGQETIPSLTDALSFEIHALALIE